MKTPKLISKIDFTTLRTQKGTLIKIIDDLEKTGLHPDQESDLTGILNLIDALQDFAVDVMGLNPIDVYDFELEEGREDVNKIRTVILCSTCNTSNILIKSIKANLCHCNVCDEERNMYQAKLKADAKVIGYQVLSNTDDCALHPKMEASFCLYSLKQCKRIVAGETSNWRIHTVWSGDIEEPTLMFKGDPDKK